MKLKEVIQREKEEMNPIRYRFNYCSIFIYLAVFISLLAASIIVGETVTPDTWVLLPSGLLLIAIVVMLIHGEIIIKKELETELERWNYLFKRDLSYEGETFETDDPETGNQYLLSRKGIKVILPIDKGQVFVELKDNEYFLPWSDVEISVATDNFARRVRLAVAVIDVSKRSIDGNYVPLDDEVHFLPMEEELIAFFRKMGIEEKFSVEWRYIQTERRDAFKQILSFGYMRTMKDENGKRIKRENADDLYRD